MLSKIFSAVLLSGALLLASCEEEPPFIDFTPKDTSLKDTTYLGGGSDTAQQRVVVIEDFTGVRCNNCPNAQGKAAQIEAAYPGRVVVMAMHPSVSFDNFTYPYSPSYDFRSSFAEDIMNMLVPPPALPYGVVNRKLFAGESARMIEYQKWESNVVSELGLNTPVNIEVVEKKKLPDSLLVTVKLTYTEAVSDLHFISIALTESGMVAPQKMPDLTTNYNYVHNHVLRTMGTLAGGQSVAKVNASSTYEKGRIYIKQFKMPLQASWKLDKCHIIVMVSKASPDLTMVHAAEVSAQ